MPLLSAVLMDLGDTLVHLDRPWKDVFQANVEYVYVFLKQSGLASDFQSFAEQFVRIFEEATTESHLSGIEIPMETIITKVLNKYRLEILDAGFVQSVVEEFYKAELSSWQLFPDAVQTLAALRESDFEIALISNSKSDWFVRTLVERHDLQRFFRTVVTSAALRFRKPGPAVFRRALDDLKVTPSNTVVIGDSLEADIAGAKALNMRSIHVVRDDVERSNLLYADATVSSLSEALSNVLRWKAIPSKADLL
jgi:putative hydrolase of the HAD superfamily